MSSDPMPSLGEAQNILEGLASVFLPRSPGGHMAGFRAPVAGVQIPDVQARYRSLVEQIPAVVFMVYLDQGIGEAYVSPQIEQTLGYSQAEWLEDPVRWYRQIHPDDSMRWSLEAAEMFLTGKPLRSVYRVIARDGQVVWFHCEAKMVRRDDGTPWFIHGSGFDISELKRAEAALQAERNFVSAILNAVGTLIIVFDHEGRVAQFNQACEQITGRRFAEVRGLCIPDLFARPEDRERFEAAFEQLRQGRPVSPFETEWTVRGAGPRLISWSGTVLPGVEGNAHHIIATGVDITEAKRLEKAILDISAREERRIGQDLHDGLGQHLTGIAFMSKVLEQRLLARSLDEAADAAAIVSLVNEAIHKTRDLSRGLLPVVSDERGLMSALEHLAQEVENLFRVSCRFECDQPVLIHEDAVATHLYHIAQEAMNNAMKHGHAKHLRVRLGPSGGGIELRVEDDGEGIPDELGNNPGMGLHIMNYRARMIGGKLEILRRPEGGTTVACRLPERHGKGEEHRS